jgi:hypothetical protein
MPITPYAFRRGIIEVLSLVTVIVVCERKRLSSSINAGKDDSAPFLQTTIAKTKKPQPAFAGWGFLVKVAASYSQRSQGYLIQQISTQNANSKAQRGSFR